MFPISLIVTTKITQLLKSLGSTGIAILLAFVLGTGLGYKLSGSYYIKEELKRTEAQLELVKKRLKSTMEVALQYKREEEGYKDQYEEFKRQISEDVQPSLNTLPSRRVYRLNTIR